MLTNFIFLKHLICLFIARKEEEERETRDDGTQKTLEDETIPPTLSEDAEGRTDEDISEADAYKEEIEVVQTKSPERKGWRNTNLDFTEIQGCK